MSHTKPTVKLAGRIDCHRADYLLDGGKALVPVTGHLLTGLPDEAGDVQLAVVPSKSQHDWYRWLVVEVETGYAVTDAFGATREEAIEGLCETCRERGWAWLARGRDKVLKEARRG